MYDASVANGERRATHGGVGSARALAAGVMLLAACASAAGQTAPAAPRWEIDAHGGFSRVRLPTGGSVAMPEPGPPIVTSSPIFPSRRVPSWFFGDGADLLNGVNAEFGLSERLTPLDAAFASLGLDATSDAAFGLRLLRELTPRYALEVSLDVVPGSTQLDEDLVAALDASRAGFGTAFGALLASGPFAEPVVSAVLTTPRGGVGRDVLATVSVVYRWPARGSFAPYVVLGGGLWAHAGGMPTASLEGAYRFAIDGTVPIDERDRVALRFEQDPVLAGVAGGGVRQQMSDRWGFRIDARVVFARSSQRLLLDAEPSIAAGTPADFIESFTSPSIQFSNDPSTGRESTLGGPPLRDFETFAGDGWQTRVLITAGLFVRF
jgi:hypothetical protein